MIEFIEKERYYDDSTFTGQCWMYPTFMVKDGIEYFMWNRREPDDSWKVNEREGQKAELLANDGSYFHFHGIYADPFEMLAEMERRGHTFTEPNNLFIDCRDNPRYGSGFVDFHGNQNEVSAAFHYRIYDADMIERIRTAVAPIIKRRGKMKHETERQTITHHGRTFELVDSVLPGYSIWNIGEHMVDGYLPLCRLAAVQPFPGGRTIETDTLKAIKCEGAQIILAAIGYGPETPEEMEQYIKRYSGKDTHTLEVERMKKALPFMRKLKWR